MPASRQKLSLLGRLRYELDALGARGYSSTAEHDGEASVVVRLTPPGSVAVYLEGRRSGRVPNDDVLDAMEVSKDREAGLVVLEPRGRHELAKPANIERNLWMRGGCPKKRAEKIEDGLVTELEARCVITGGELVELINASLVDGDGEVLGRTRAIELLVDLVDLGRLLELERLAGAVARDLHAKNRGWLADDGDVVALGVRQHVMLVGEVAAAVREAEVDVVDVDSKPNHAPGDLLAPDVGLDSAALEAESEDGVGVPHNPEVARLLGPLERS